MTKKQKAAIAAILGDIDIDAWWAGAREVLAWRVVDPNAWCAHAWATFDPPMAAKAIVDKVERWRPACEAQRAARGSDYKVRAVREAEQLAGQQAIIAGLLEAETKRRTDERATLKAEIIAELTAAGVIRP